MQGGLLVFDQDGKIVDRVGSAREDVESFCAMGQPLPGVLNGLHGESWQRVDITGDDRRDFIVAERTPGRRNAEAPQHQRVDSPVRITEVTNGGPGGAGDNFFELTNTGDAPVDVTGWQVYRCTGTGRVYDGMLQLSLPDGEVAPGEVFTAARTGADSTVEHPDATYGTSFNAVDGSGLMVVDKDRNVVDSVGVFDRVDSPCTAGEPLSDTLDFASGESYQRVAFTGDNAKDYVRAIRTPGEYVLDVNAIEVQKPKMGDAVINEIAAGRPDDKGGKKAQYIEIINNGSTPADLSELRMDYCAVDERRMLEPAAVVPDGLSLAPGGVFTVARPEAGVKVALATGATSWSSPATCTVCVSASPNVRMAPASSRPLRTTSRTKRTAPATPCTRAFTSSTWIPGRSRPTRIHRACSLSNRGRTPRAIWATPRNPTSSSTTPTCSTTSR